MNDHTASLEIYNCERASVRVTIKFPRIFCTQCTNMG